MDEFLIELQAKLDEAKSKGNINDDINRLQKQIDKLKVQAELDPKAAQNLADNIGKLINQKITISNIGVDTKSATKAGQDYGQQFFQGVSQGIKDNMSALNSFKNSLKNIGMGSKEIDAVANKINDLGVKIEALNQTRSVGKKDILSVNIAGIDQYGQAIKLTQQYNIATGKLVNTIDAVSTAQQNIGNNTNSIKRAQNVLADYTAKIEQFKSTNSNILSGLSEPLSDFENKLSGLKNGSTSIDDVINSYKNLSAEAAKITSNLSAQFNKVDSAVRNIAKGDEVIASLRADFKGLSNAPKEVNSELNKCEKLLLNIKNIESQEGRTINWSAAYKEWEQSLNSLKAKISTFKKEQSNVASTQIFNTKDLETQGKIYLQKVNNTIAKAKSELESKLRNAGYMDIEIKGTEDAKGKIKSLTATVTDAAGVFKQLNFERAKIQGSGKAQAGFVQSDDVKVVGNISSAIDKVQDNLSSLKTKWEEQGVLVGEFQNKVDQLEFSLSSVGSKNELNGLKEQIHELKSEASTISQVNQIQLSMAGKNTKSKNYDYQIDTEIKKLRDLGFTNKEAAQKVKILTDSQAELKRVMDSSEFDSVTSKNKAIIESDKERTIALNQVRTAYGQLKNDANQYYNLNKQSKLSTDVQNWLFKNSRASKEAKESLNAYYRELSNGRVSVDRLNYIEKELKDIDATQRGLHRLGKNLKDQFAEAAQNFTQWLSVSSAIMTLIYQLQKMPKEVYEIDTAMTNLYKVTDETEAKYTRFLDSASTSAKNLSRSVSSLVDQTANWAKLGFNIDEAEHLAKISSIYANVGEVDDATAVSDIVTALKAFNITASDSITIVDKLNKLGNEFATDAASLGDGLSKSASALALAGNDINKTLAMLTGGTEITQNASEMGNALKVLSMRIRGMKGELQQLGEEYEDIESISKIQTQILNQTHGAVNIFDESENFRSTYDILKDISEVWSEISEIDQADLLETIAGKQRGNQIAALIQAFQSGQIEKAYEASVNAAGSAMQEQERWMGSLEAKIQQLEASFQSLSNTVLDSGLLKGVVDLGTAGVSALDSIISKFGIFNTASTAISGILGAKGLGLTNYVTITS